MMELLAPAGDMETAKTALHAGADACYIGGEMSARAYAKNFTKEDIAEILEYAHLRGRKIYVAVNTMILQSELQTALTYLDFLYASGADGVIVADIGLAASAHALYPNLPLHASTQMGVLDALGAAFVKKLGCTRVVAARESTFDELREMADTGIEVEAFCHGALCSGISGMCLMSSFLGGRSGNRGKCAQPCRMTYELLGGKAYHLSTADLCTIGFLEKFRDAGVRSLKIEGRMKRREYVAVTVDAYRRALDALEEGCFDTEGAVYELKKIYNRGGFTEGFYLGNRDVTYPLRQNHMGVPIGKIARITAKGKALLLTDKVLQKGDGLEFMGEESHGGLNIAFADRVKGGYSIPVTAQTRPGDTIFRTTDIEQLNAALEIAERDEFHIPVRAELCLAEGERARLTLFAEELSIEAEGAVCEPANHPLNPEKVKEWLEKTGGTVFEIESRMEFKGNPFIRSADVNALRREGLAKLKAQILQKRSPYQTVYGPALPDVSREPEAYLAVQVKTIEQAAAAWQGGADRVYFAPEHCDGRLFEQLTAAKQGQLYLVLPPYWSREDRQALEVLLASGGEVFDGIVAANVGQAEFAAVRGIPFVSDYWQNIANRASAGVLSGLGAKSLCGSAELNLRDWSGLAGAAEEATVYGFLPLMNLRHCPVKKMGKCGECGKAALRDRYGYEFRLARAGIEDCLVQVLNSVPMAMTDLPALSNAGITALRLVFAFESDEMVKNVTQAYKRAFEAGKKAYIDDIIKNNTNTGHFLRGIT